MHHTNALERQNPSAHGAVYAKQGFAMLLHEKHGDLVRRVLGPQAAEACNLLRCVILAII